MVFAKTEFEDVLDRTAICLLPLSLLPLAFNGGREEEAKIKSCDAVTSFLAV